jgi:hypothetical protein
LKRNKEEDRCKNDVFIETIFAMLQGNSCAEAICWNGTVIDLPTTEIPITAK